MLTKNKYYNKGSFIVFSLITKATNQKATFISLHIHFISFHYIGLRIAHKLVDLFAYRSCRSKLSFSRMPLVVNSPRFLKHSNNISGIPNSRYSQWNIGANVLVV